MTPAHVNGLDAPTKTATVKVGKSEYQIQWGPLAEYILSARGLTTSSILPGLVTPKAVALKIEMLRAFTAHIFRTAELPESPEWAARLFPGQLDDAFLAMRGLLIDAKVWVSLEKNAPAPMEQTTQDQAQKV